MRRIAPSLIPLIQQKAMEENKARDKELAYKMKIADEERKFQRGIKEYAIKKAIDTKFGQDEDYYKKHLKARSDLSDLEDPTASWKKPIHEAGKKEVMGDQYDYLQAQKAKGVPLTSQQQIDDNELGKKVNPSVTGAEKGIEDVGIYAEEYQTLTNKIESGQATLQEKIRHGAIGKKLGMSADMGSVEGVTSEQQLQARNLARKRYGVRGAEKALPAIYAMLKQGKTIDEIDDNLRFSSQSDKMTGAVRSTMQSILMGASPTIQDRTMDFVDDALNKGNFDEVKQLIKRTVLAQAPVDQKNQLVGSERTFNFLNEIQGDIQQLESQGVNTNIFAGTMEEIFRKIGTVKEPGLRKVATKIAAAIQKYRRSMSGVAFSEPESREYSQMFPSISKTGLFNTANIEGLKEVLSGDLENMYSMYMGKDNYNSIFKSGSTGNQSSGFKIISEENI